MLCRMILIFALLGISCAANAQQDFSDVVVEATPIRDGLYLVTGRGGNIVASSGDDGLFLVDDQYAPLTERIQAALEEITDRPVRFVINTHWHGDHVGGNENFAEAGAVIIAHENVRSRMSSDQFMAAFNRTVPAAPAKALPVVTFAEGVTLHLNGNDVQIIHVANAHTDGDALVYFRNANVLHMGDIQFNGLYPFIDLGSGGGIHGVIAGVERALELADDETIVVPGHGPLSNRAELAAYGAMLAGFRDRIGALKAEGLSLEEVVAAQPTAEFDERLGGGFIPPARLVGSIYDSL
ncbi:MAG: MBL fold metallo-hydrolase [Gammaproteobacteria bacterium]